MAFSAAKARSCLSTYMHSSSLCSSNQSQAVFPSSRTVSSLADSSCRLSGSLSLPGKEQRRFSTCVKPFRGGRLGLHLRRHSFDSRTQSKLRDSEEAESVTESGQPEVGLGVGAWLTRPKLWLQVVLVIATLGFVDAGYSGDWSRIGVLSTDTEDLLKTLAFVVCPASAFTVYILSRD